MRREPSPLGGAWRRRRDDLVASVTLVCVAVYGTWPLARHAGSRVAGNLGDPLELAWRFGWVGHAVLHSPGSLFDANMYHPERLTLAFSENHVGASLPVAPLFWLTGNALLSLNTGVILALAVGGFGVHLLVKDLTGSHPAALLAGAAYTAAPFRISAVGLGHVHVVDVHLTPYALLVLLRMREDPSWRRVAALAALVGWQWWSSLTGALATMIAVGVWALWEAIGVRRHGAATLRGAAVGIIAGLLLAVPVVSPYLSARRAHPDYQHDPMAAIILSATPASYLTPTAAGPVAEQLYSVLSERFRRDPAPSEKELFPGLWVLGAATVAVVAGVSGQRRRPRPARPRGTLGLFAAIAAVAFTLSLGPHLGARPEGATLPFKLISGLIPGGLMRVPARIGVLVTLAVCVMAGLGLSQARRRLRRPLVAGSVALLALELMPPRLDLVTPPPITAAHRALANRPGAVLALPTVEFSDAGVLDGPSIPREAQHLYLSTAHFRPMVNGYGAYAPPSYWKMVHAVQKFPSSHAFAMLRARGVQYVVVQSDLATGTRWDGVDERLRSWPGVRAMSTAPGVNVFDIRRAADAPAGHP